MEVAQLCQLYSAMGIASIVRIPSPDPYAACQMIDAGAEGVLSPYIENTEQIRGMVGAVKYRPLKGERLEEAVADPDSLDPQLLEYLHDYNRGNLCLINIESKPAVDQLDDLLTQPGVDAVFIGPHDLSVSLDVPEQYDDLYFEGVVCVIIRKYSVYGVAEESHFYKQPERQIHR